MFALLKHDQSATGDGVSRRPRTPVRRNGDTEHNPLWQSLALRPAVIQTKLTVSQPGDAYEQEADRVADQVMRMPSPESSPQTGSPTLSDLSFASLKAQRKCAGCEEEEDEDEKPDVQRKEQGASPLTQGVVSPAVHQALGSPGESLDSTTRGFFEPRFGRDFSHVRVHADASAAESARTVNAQAYTVGNRIVFGPGRYRPQTFEGQQLLAHELAHVAQQGGDSSPGHGGRGLAGSGEDRLQRKIIVGGQDYQPNSLYLTLLDLFDKRTSELITKMHNDGKPPEYKFASYEELGQEVTMRSNIVQGMEEVHNGCCSYPMSGGTGKLDQSYWYKMGPYQFKVREKLPKGKDASDAIEAIFKPGARTELECNSTLVAIQYRAMLLTLGDVNFNKKFPGGAGIIISPHHQPPTDVAVHPIWEKNLYKKVTINGVSDLLPGDWVYFKNIADYGEKHPGGFWAGEHALYLGLDKFRGFGVQEFTREELEKELLAKYNLGLPVGQHKTHADVPGLQNYARRPVIEEITK